MIDIFRRIKMNRLLKRQEQDNTSSYEFCPRCEANLTLQKGYSNELPYWICRGCGEMLFEPSLDIDGIVWVCDGCGEMLNIQEGFSNDCGVFTCTKCGFINKIDSSEIYISEDEFQSSLMNPYKGLSDEEVLELSAYEDVDYLNGREDIILVKNPEDGRLYVKKILSHYDIDIYKYLSEHPVANMPRLLHIYESDNNLIIIEDYIEGLSLSEYIEQKKPDASEAVKIVKNICGILSALHNLDKPIIHRDIKPSNIIISNEGEVFLLDIDVAKWYKADESEDTRLFGTLYYAAPEQFGYGFSASSGKTDIYAVGMLMNVILTGKLPKEEKAEGPLWAIIERCISLEPEQRYTADELLSELENVTLL